MLTVGAALSLTGRFAVQGEQARRGLTLWAEHTSHEGVLEVNLVVYDDGSKIAGATAATERLIAEDRVDLLFSPYSSVLTLAAAEVAARHGRLLWNHGGSSDALKQRGWQHVVTLLSPASQYLVPILDLANEQSLKTVALLYGASGTFPKAVADGARAHARRLGLHLVLDAPYPVSHPGPPPGGERASLLEEDNLPAPAHGGGAGGRGASAPGPGGEGFPDLTDIGPGLILGVGTTEADLAFARELRRQGLSSALIGLVAAPIEHFGEALGANADGFCGPSQWEPTLPTRPDLGPTSVEFAAAFRTRFGLEPDYPAAQAYAAGLIAAHCVQQAGSLNDADLRRVAGALDLATFYGRFRLDQETGQQVGHEIVVVQWQAGRKEIVWPPPAATASLQLPVPTTALTGCSSGGDVPS
jgi:branched-chain amino acid transport system substrate-binding protein